MRALATAALLSLCACSAPLATDQPPSEAGADVASGPLQDTGAVANDASTIAVVDAGSGDGASVDATEPSNTTDAVATMCQVPNPVGCTGLPDACQLGFFCDTDPAHGCAPSICACSPPQGWGCSADCGGGVCRPVEDASGLDADLPDAMRCCAIGVDYVSCHACEWCTDAGRIPQYCPPGRFCAASGLCEDLDAGADADAADGDPLCYLGTPLTLGPCRPRDN